MSASQKRLGAVFSVLCFLITASLRTANAQQAYPPSPLDQPVRFVGAWSPYFEANNGQFDESILFVSRGTDYSMALLRDGMLLTIINPQAGEKSTSIQFKFLGSALYPGIEGEDPYPRKMKYYAGRDRPELFEVTAYRQVRYGSIFPGIDLFFSCNPYYLEYYFALSPRARLSDVVFEITGAEKLALNEEGDLVIRTQAGVLIRPAPRLFEEEASGLRKEIKGGYVLLANNRVGFDADTYNQMAKLIVDPVLIFFNSKENWVQPAQTEAQGK